MNIVRFAGRRSVRPSRVFAVVNSALSAAVVFVGLSDGAPNALAAAVADLRCEYLVDPEGIDAQPPRVSWILESTARGEKQIAYQILAASTADNLNHDRGDLWDSGRVESDQSTLVSYAGRPLDSFDECFWKVRAWTAKSGATEWSRPARWSMGVLKPEHWQAQWIGRDEPQRDEKLAGTNWIWFPEEDPAVGAPPGVRYFRRTFEVPADRVVKRVVCRIAGDDKCVIYLDGREVARQVGHQTAKEVDLTDRATAGRHVLGMEGTNAGESPNPASMTLWMKIEFDSGEPLFVVTDDAWKCAKEAPADWYAAEFDDSDWGAVKVIGPVGIEPWGAVACSGDRRLAARQLRKEFVVDKPIRRAVAYVCGLGSSELYVDGRKAGDHVLSPGATQYDKRQLYVAHDVTGLLRQGPNALGALLGNGRFYSPRDKSFVNMPNFGYPKLLLLLRIEREDGSIQQVVSDGSWKLSVDGPIVANNEYDGEEYDARRDLGDWSSPGYDDAQWSTADVVASPGGIVSAQMMPPIRVTETLRAVAVDEPRPGVFVFDLGQNMVGWCRLRVRGPAGTTVALRHAETLQSDGTLYVANLRGAMVTDKYTLADPEDAEQVYEPRFTYHGFRYVEVVGYPVKPTLAAIEGRVVHDDLRPAGDFACSNDLLNKIYKCVVWGTRGNYRSMPTDCPQRDERQGWLGDRGEECRGETYIYEIAPLYAKWLRDMTDSQKESGSVSDVCPAHWPFYSDNVTWPSTLVLAPEVLRTQYGDIGPITERYAGAKKWIEYMLGMTKDGVIDRDSYGDWCVPPEDPKLIHSKDPARQTDKALLATSYLYHDLKLMEQYAKLLGKSEDAAEFSRRATELYEAFNGKFLSREKGQYDNGTQTSCVLPLFFGLVPDDMQDKVFERLVRKITQETNNHIGTGLIGGQFLNRVLADRGRGDLAYLIASQSDYPSWGYMIANGATTVWELWNGDTADPAMNSGNHVMLVGDLVVWLYEYLAGIRPDEARPGFKHIVMRPQPVGDLTWVKASHRSPYGLIRSEWRREGGQFRWQVTIPANTTATITMPAKSAESAREGSTKLAEAEGVEQISFADGKLTAEAGSGEYSFTTELP
jgi:alpha-L-rhamnosidase